ncbi:MAG: hypothetical protein SFW08_06460 [Gemmatimonadaceae bacterium]|nr:hypothetical protein [Gemmatimonadaceae bacterium]
MLSREELVGFLDRLATDGATYREVGDGLWAVRPAGGLELDVVVHHSPPVVLLRVKVMDLPADPADIASMSRKLLEWNASDLVHGSYGIAGGTVVITEALELGHLDFEEFRAAYEAITLALVAHVRELASFRGAR